MSERHCGFTKKKLIVETFLLPGSSNGCTNTGHAATPRRGTSRKRFMSSIRSTLHTTSRGQKAQAKWCALSGRLEAGLRQDTYSTMLAPTSIFAANPEVGT